MLQSLGQTTNSRSNRIVRALGALLRDRLVERDVSQRMLVRDGVMTYYQARSLEEKLLDGTLPISTLFSLTDYLGINLLGAGLALEMIQAGHDPDALDTAVIGLIAVALTDSMVRADSLDTSCINETTCKMVAEKITRMLQEHSERQREKFVLYKAG